MGHIHPAVSEICDPQSLGLICGKFDKFLAHGQAHMGQMGKWPWQCTTRGLDNSTELQMEKIRQAVTEIWVPQVWQPPAQPPARTVTTIPLQPGRLSGKKLISASLLFNRFMKDVRIGLLQLKCDLWGAINFGHRTKHVKYEWFWHRSHKS